MSVNPNGLPSESLQTADALPGGTTLPPSRLDLLQHPGQIVHGEVGQGEGVAEPATPRMEPTGGVAECVCQPSPSCLGSRGTSRQTGPEASSPLRVIRGKLDH
jgi:hypothetical protein